jgi:hypothetical protein
MERVSTIKQLLRVTRWLTIYIVGAGDSGAWVVHVAAPELYGHVVATNTFGDACVMPALDVLENMRQCFGATSVALPTACDLAKDSVETENIDSDRVSHSPSVGSKVSEIHRYDTAYMFESDDGSSSETAAETTSQVSSCYTKPLRNIHNQPKSWSPVFFKPRNIVHDRPLRQIIREIGVERSPLDVVLNPCAPDRMLASFDLEAITRIIPQGNTDSVYNDVFSRASFDYTSRQRDSVVRETKSSLTAAELAQVIETQVRLPCLLTNSH